MTEQPDRGNKTERRSPGAGLDSIRPKTEIGFLEDDPVLGRCTVFRGSRSLLWRRIAFLILGVGCSLVMAALGVSGVRGSVTFARWLLALWPLLALLACVLAWGILLALRDAVGPRYSDLRIGENGFAVTRGTERTVTPWSSVRAVKLAPSFWGAWSVRVSLKYPGLAWHKDDTRVSDSFLLRVDLMSVSAREAEALMSRVRNRRKDATEVAKPAD